MQKNKRGRKLSCPTSVPAIIQTIYKQFPHFTSTFGSMAIFCGFSCSGSFTHLFPTDLEGLHDDIWGFLQPWAPIITEEGCRQKWDEKEEAGPCESTLQGEQSSWQDGQDPADGFAFLAPVRCLPSMPVAMANGKVTCVFLGAGPSESRNLALMGNRCLAYALLALISL